MQPGLYFAVASEEWHSERDSSDLQAPIAQGSALRARHPGLEIVNGLLLIIDRSFDYALN